MVREMDSPYRSPVLRATTRCSACASFRHRVRPGLDPSAGTPPHGGGPGGGGRGIQTEETGGVPRDASPAGPPAARGGGRWRRGGDGGPWTRRTQRRDRNEGFAPAPGQRFRRRPRPAHILRETAASPRSGRPPPAPGGVARRQRLAGSSEGLDTQRRRTGLGRIGITRRSVLAPRRRTLRPCGRRPASDLIDDRPSTADLGLGARSCVDGRSSGGRGRVTAR